MTEHEQRGCEMTDLNALADELLSAVCKPIESRVYSTKLMLKINTALRAAASSQAGVLAMREKAEPVLSFLDELAANAAPGKREPLNSILIGGSAKLYAEGFRAAIDNIEMQAGVETAPPSQEPVAVKPLEWDERGRADVYTVWQDGLRVDEKYFMARGDKILGWFDSEEAAKAAAQTDYEQRIRSALVSPTPALRTALDQIIISAMEWHPSENGPSYIEHRADLQSMLNAALRSHPAPAPSGNTDALRKALDLLQLQQRGRAKASRLLDKSLETSDPATLAAADAYEECGNELSIHLFNGGRDAE